MAVKLCIKRLDLWIERKGPAVAVARPEGAWFESPPPPAACQSILEQDTQIGPDEHPLPLVCECVCVCMSECHN